MADGQRRRRRRPARRRRGAPARGGPAPAAASLTSVAASVVSDRLSEPPRSNHSMIGFASASREVAVEHVGDGGADQVARHLVGALQLAFVLELELAGHRRQRGVDVGDARHDRRFAVGERAPLGVRDDGLEHADRQALADARALVDLALVARLERDLLDDLAHERRHLDAAPPRSTHASCAVIAMRVGAALHVVRADLGADAVLERRDDLAARGVVLGVGGEGDQHVERQADRVALDLDVAFLQDVEQADLDLAGEVGQLVDREDAAIGARQQAEVHRQLAAELQAALGGLDRIDVADHVGDGHVRRRELLDVARLARQPAIGISSPSALTRCLAERRQRRDRVVVDLAVRESPASTRRAASSARAACASSPGRAGRAG